MCNETIKEIRQKISLAENHQIELMEEKKKIEEDLENTKYVIYCKVW